MLAWRIFNRWNVKECYTVCIVDNNFYMKKPLIIILAAAVIIIGIILIARKQDAVVVAPVTDTAALPADTVGSDTTPSSTSGTRVRGPEEKTLMIGQDGVIVDGITIKVVSLMQDSRCPTDVTCIQAGTVGVKTTVTKGKVTTSHDFITGTKPFSFQGYNIEIVNVIPSKISTAPAIKLSDYRITFRAQPTAKGDNI
jgi:hypothetical protein